MSLQPFDDKTTPMCLRSVEGWLELGNVDEADRELTRIGERDASHPDVLTVRWSVLAAAERWDEAHGVAERHSQVAPMDERAVVNQAYAMRRKADGSLALAQVVLLRAWPNFPESVLIPYNLACYNCQSDDLESALLYLRHAVENGDEKAVLAMAKKDPDLEPLHASLDHLA